MKIFPKINKRGRLFVRYRLKWLNDSLTEWTGLSIPSLASMVYLERFLDAPLGLVGEEVKGPVVDPGAVVHVHFLVVFIGVGDGVSVLCGVLHVPQRSFVLEDISSNLQNAEQ